MSVFGQLLDACEDGDLRLVKKLLRRDPSLLNKQDKDGWTPLITACGVPGGEALVQFLLEKGAAVDLATMDGVTALCLASQEGYEGTVKLLLEKGAAIDLANNKGTTALILASQYGHEGTVRLLLEKGAAIGHTKSDGATALVMACQNGHEGTVRLLL